MDTAILFKPRLPVKQKMPRDSFSCLPFLPVYALTYQYILLHFAPTEKTGVPLVDRVNAEKHPRSTVCQCSHRCLLQGILWKMKCGIFLLASTQPPWALGSTSVNLPPVFLITSALPEVKVPGGKCWMQLGDFAQVLPWRKNYQPVVTTLKAEELYRRRQNSVLHKSREKGGVLQAVKDQHTVAILSLINSSALSTCEHCSGIISLQSWKKNSL